ncbi:DUF2946 family protein [Sphingomonas sp. GlSt437]|uniref:DUF2946 family protein n=1 Tax=Sphingomonas sp. GlSt437 TaxID=3389970 RepID=UPI003A8A237D
MLVSAGYDARVNKVDQRHGLTMRAFYALTLLALLFKSYVPSGFMVAQGGTIVICTGIGPMTMADPRHDAPAAPDKKSDHCCPFAGNAAPPLPPATVPLLAMPGPDQARVADAALDIVPGRGLAAPPPPSRAPPFSLA